MLLTVVKYEEEYQNSMVTIELLTAGKNAVYKATFANGEWFFLTKVLSIQSGDFWTSIPEGRQQLAEAIGPLIDKHITFQKSKLKTPKEPPPNPPSLF